MQNMEVSIKSIPDNDKHIYHLYDSDNNELIIPNSIAIILDGNGRFAKKNSLPVSGGHRQGCIALENILEESVRIGVKYLTVYAFSTENWKRSESEINSLFDLFFLYLNKIEKKSLENNVRIRFIGDIYKFPENLYSKCEHLIQVTKNNTGLVFVIAFNYGSRDEILRAFKKISKKNVDFDTLSVDDISDSLDTSGIMDPDLLIRTSGEQRLSNFLLWQSAYSELYFTNTLWPEFTIEEYHKAIFDYNSRERRYGGRTN